MQILNTQFSLKNPHALNGWIVACDMESGGFRVFDEDFRYFWHFFPGYTMAWNPYLLDGGMPGIFWLYFCDTQGREPFWDHMRIYRVYVDFKSGYHGSIQKISVYQEEHGLIDPCLWFHNEWWYLSVVRLWDYHDRRWWEPAISVSRSPDGPFLYKHYLGISDLNLSADVMNIDEAFKTTRFLNHYHCLWSTGDSGVNGISHMGHLIYNGKHPDGWAKCYVQHIADLRSDDPDRPLFTAPCEYRNGLLVTTRDPGYVSMRDKFRIGTFE